MNTRAAAVIIVLALSVGVAKRALAQGSFGNLDFESATFVPIPGDPNGRVEFAAALPGWTGYINGQPQTALIPNGIPIGPVPVPFISVMTAQPGSVVLQGSYTLAYSSGFDSLGNVIPVALAQTGQVPAASQSLRFLAAFRPAVLLDGNSMSPVALGAGPSQTTLFGIDISSFAGRTVELRFQPGLGFTYLDDIQFSNQPIPEPSVFGLVALGALLLGGRFVWRVRKTT